MEHRICKKCNKLLPLDNDNFYWDEVNKWCKKCISCVKERAASYRQKNRAVIREKAKIYNSLGTTKENQKEYRKNNKQKLRHDEKMWRLNNPEKYSQIVKRKSKKRRLLPKNKIRLHISRQIAFALKRQASSKFGNSVMKFLPYTVEELRQHLENQFEYWMNWDNYGKYSCKTWDDDNYITWKWQIDHIIPQSTLPYSSMEDENFKKCWALENLRPLSAKQNSLDGAFKVRHRAS